MMNKGTCLVSQQIRDLIETNNLIIPESHKSTIEDRIQPSSFDPVIGDEIFILDTDFEGLFRPHKDKSVYRSLIELAGLRRPKKNISGGFELKKGFTYLARLEEKINLQENSLIKSSPKSSLGRLFLNTRLLTDFNPCFDEVNSHYKTDAELDLWLLIQPLAFNVIAHPGISFNQLRFFKGYNAQLTPSEILEEFSKNPLLMYKKDDEYIPAKPIVNEGLQIHLNLSGEYSEGIIGLRARRNPEPIDLNKRNEYEAEHFFEPLKGKIAIKRSERYLLGSKEILRIPEHLNVQLKAHHHIGLHGPLHFAGFIDNGFKGDLVFEVISEELTDMVLEDGMPISILDIFRTDKPDKIYGEKINSNYQKQIGPRPAKYFKPFNFKMAAKTYAKLDKMVLVQDAKILLKHRNKKEGFEFCSKEKSEELFKDINNGFFQSRYDCEHDELILQPSSYVLVFGPDKNIFSYERSGNIEVYGDKRLFGKFSIGPGGHILQKDGPDFINNSIQRKVIDDELNIIGDYSEIKFIGTLMAYTNPVDRVHFGLIYVIHSQGKVEKKGESMVSSKMIPFNEFSKDPDFPEKYETWSQTLIPYLKEIYEKTK